MTTTTPNLNWIANYIWGIADDVLRDVYVRGKYRDVILPMTVLRRLDAVLEPTKQAVLDMKVWLDEQGIVEQKETLRQAAGQAFYNTSKFTLHDLRARASRQQLRADFEDYRDGFSPGVQDILENFEFRNQIPRLSKCVFRRCRSPVPTSRSPIPEHADHPGGAEVWLGTGPFVPDSGDSGDSGDSEGCGPAATDPWAVIRAAQSRLSVFSPPSQGETRSRRHA